jgi:hypothetical protein
MELLPGAYIPSCAKPCNNAPIIMTFEPHMIAHRRPTHWLKAGAKGTAQMAPSEYDALIIPSSGGLTDKAFEIGSLYPSPKSWKPSMVLQIYPQAHWHWLNGGMNCNALINCESNPEVIWLSQLCSTGIQDKIPQCPRTQGRAQDIKSASLASYTKAQDPHQLSG